MIMINIVVVVMKQYYMLRKTKSRKSKKIIEVNRNLCAFFINIIILYVYILLA